MAVEIADKVGVIEGMPTALGDGGALASIEADDWLFSETPPAA